MKIGALIPIAVFGLVLVGLAIRLVALWWRSREWPELLLGSSLAVLAFLAIPLSALGRLPGWATTGEGRLLFDLGMSAVAIGLFLLFAFTAQVFRKASRWRPMALAVVAVVLAIIAAGALRANHSGVTLEEILPQTRPWSLSFVYVVLCHFAWSTGEALAVRRALRRRLRIGLADPVVVNRFLLWAIASASVVALCVGLLMCIHMGMVIVREAPPMRMITAMAVVLSATWYLTFFAPNAYKRFILKRYQASLGPITRPASFDA